MVYLCTGKIIYITARSNEKLIKKSLIIETGLVEPPKGKAQAQGRVSWAEAEEWRRVFFPSKLGHNINS